MGERPIGSRLDSDTRTSLEEELVDSGQIPPKYTVSVTGWLVGYRFDTTRPRWGEYSHVHTRPTLMLEDTPNNKRRRMHGSGGTILFDDDYYSSRSLLQS